MYNSEKFKQNKTKYVLIIALIIAVFITIYIVGGLFDPKTEIPEIRGTVETEKTITKNGVTYAPKKRTATMLFIGTDENLNNQKPLVRGGIQADFIFLTVIDYDENQFHLIHIDRDSIVEMPVTNIVGKNAGTTTQQICLSYAFGTSQQESVEMTKTAVNNLMGGIQIDHYGVINMEDFKALNDGFGGVTVELPEEMVQFFPGHEEGDEVTLFGDDAELFVRARRGVGDGTNAGRMKRQRIYLKSAFDSFKKGFRADGKAYLNKLLLLIEQYVKNKDVTKAWIEETFYKVAECNWGDIIVLEGEHTVGKDGFTEFHADPDFISDLMLNIYYSPVENDY